MIVGVPAGPPILGMGPPGVSLGLLSSTSVSAASRISSTLEKNGSHSPVRSTPRSAPLILRAMHCTVPENGAWLFLSRYSPRVGVMTGPPSPGSTGPPGMSGTGSPGMSGIGSLGMSGIMSGAMSGIISQRNH
jgi:hypothetical protein